MQPVPVWVVGLEGLVAVFKQGNMSVIEPHYQYPNMLELADLASWWRPPEKGERTKANEQGWCHSRAWLTCPICVSPLMLVNWADEEHRRCLVRKQPVALRRACLVLASVWNELIRTFIFRPTSSSHTRRWWRRFDERGVATSLTVSGPFRFGCTFCCDRYFPNYKEYIEGWHQIKRWLNDGNMEQNW